MLLLLRGESDPFAPLGGPPSRPPDGIHLPMPSEIFPARSQTSQTTQQRAVHYTMIHASVALYALGYTPGMSRPAVPSARASAVRMAEATKTGRAVDLSMYRK